jgi:hypothetical protein
MFKLRRDAQANVGADERLTDPAAHGLVLDSDTEGSKEAHAAAGQAAGPQAEMLTLAVRVQAHAPRSPWAADRERWSLPGVRLS